MGRTSSSYEDLLDICYPTHENKQQICKLTNKYIMQLYIVTQICQSDNTVRKED